MEGDRPLSSLTMRWQEVRHADGGFYLAWRTITFLLVMLGFLALASTGELGAVVVVLFVALWGLGFAMLKPPAFWRGWMGRVVVWLVLAVIGSIAMKGKFVSVLYLMLFLTLYKCFTLREAIDHLHALIMSFFMFLACSVITSSIAYMVFMFCFIILMMLDLICLTIAREGSRVYTGFGSGQSIRGAAGTASLNVWRRLFISSLFVGSIVLLLTLVFFLILPHYSAYHIPNPWIDPLETQQNTALSGYSEDVSFGNLNQLKLDDSEVMEVYVQWEDGNTRRPFPPMLRLRGQALDEYNEEKWTTHARGPARESTRWSEINFQPLPANQGPVLIQRIRRQNIAAVRRLFGASMPMQFLVRRNRQSYGGGFQGYQRGESMDYFKLRLERYTQGIQIVPFSAWSLNSLPQAGYTVYSNVVEDAMPFMRALIRAGQADPGNKALIDPAGVVLPGFSYRPDPNLKLSASEQRINTYLPHSNLSGKLVELSRQVANQPSTPEKIVQLINWFYSNFEYSLTPSTPLGRHPIEAFLMRTHKGHCEYFASAFVLLLRAQGVPARLATGFYTAEMKTSESGDDCYVVRQSDAHAWAEVWLDGYGWFTFDPTPPDWRGRTTRMRETPSLWSKAGTEIKVLWQRYVLDYSDQTQIRLLADLKSSRFTRAVSLAIQSALTTSKSLLLLDNDGSPPSNQEIYTRTVLLLIAMLLAALLLVKFLGRNRQGAANAYQRSPVTFMNQLLRRLQAQGWKRAPSQTPAEWISEIEHQTEGRWQLGWLVDLYHRCRFAEETPTPDEVHRVREILRQLR